MGLRYALAKVTSTTLTWGLRHVLHRPAANLPGKIALYVDPNVIAEAASKLKTGSIMVVGTNGKTSVTNLVADTIEASGLSVMCNRTGANLDSGVATAMLQSRKSQWGVFESDEMWLVKSLPKLKSDYVLLLNLFRDQLDRFGEIARIQDSIVSALRQSPTTTLIYNADDPLCAIIADRVENPTISFGIQGDLGLEQNTVTDAQMCQRCDGMVKYKYRQYGQLGDYYCDSCEFRRPELDYYAADVTMTEDGAQFSVVERETDDVEALHVSQGSAYLIYNTLVVYALARQLGISVDIVQRAIREFNPQNGRLQSFRAANHNVLLNLAKNPTGFNQNLKIVHRDLSPKAVAFFINDKTADGHDISWIWDIDFEELADHEHTVIYAGGTRRNDLQVRLKYAEIDAELIDDINDMFSRLPQTELPSDANVYAIANYTALPKVHKDLEALCDRVSRQIGSMPVNDARAANDLFQACSEDMQGDASRFNEGVAPVDEDSYAVSEVFIDDEVSEDGEVFADDGDNAAFASFEETSDLNEFTELVERDEFEESEEIVASDDLAEPDELAISYEPEDSEASEQSEQLGESEESLKLDGLEDSAEPHDSLDLEDPAIPSEHEESTVSDGHGMAAQGNEIDAISALDPEEEDEDDEPWTKVGKHAGIDRSLEVIRGSSITLSLEAGVEPEAEDDSDGEPFADDAPVDGSADELIEVVSEDVASLEDLADVMEDVAVSIGNCGEEVSADIDDVDDDSSYDDEIDGSLDEEISDGIDGVTTGVDQGVDGDVDGMVVNDAVDEDVHGGADSTVADDVMGDHVGDSVSDEMYDNADDGIEAMIGSFDDIDEDDDDDDFFDFDSTDPQDYGLPVPVHAKEPLHSTNFISTQEPPLVIVHMLPDLLNLYGDGGNVRILQKRCEWRSIPHEVRRIEYGDEVDLSEVDLLFLGGGPDREQKLASELLMSMKDEIISFVKGDGTVLAICGGYQILGKEWLLQGNQVEGLGLIDMETRRPGTSADRLIGNMVMKSSIVSIPVVGYENHAGRTYLGKDVRSFGEIISPTGHGNNDDDKTDGVLYRNVVGTYSHGPLLSKNPGVADYLLRCAMHRRAYRTGFQSYSLIPLDDTVELEANKVMCERLGVNKNRRLIVLPPPSPSQKAQEEQMTQKPQKPQKPQKSQKPQQAEKTQKPQKDKKAQKNKKAKKTKKAHHKK